VAGIFEGTGRPSPPRHRARAPDAEKNAIVELGGFNRFSGRTGTPPGARRLYYRAHKQQHRCGEGEHSWQVEPLA
jgi:hypothetical protein